MIKANNGMKDAFRLIMQITFVQDMKKLKGGRDED
jgi:hypothetical protein